MNRVDIIDGKRRRPSWHFVRLGLLTTSVAALAPAVFAQEGDLSGLLTENVRCFGLNAKEDLGYNIKKLQASDQAIGAALNRVAADEAQCAPMREAAAELAKGYVVMPLPPSDEEIAAESARKVLEQTLAEADSRVGTLKFEAGPPPRNMTRDRPTAPNSGR